MKLLFTLLIFIVPVIAKSQVICGTANEGGIVTLTAPPGYFITTINFASYGTPNGSCGSFTTGSCHAANSIDVCTAVFVGLNSASISATNEVFGDPCNGTAKRLYITAGISSILPIHLVSFSARPADPGIVHLEWHGSQETNTEFFQVERSSDGIQFETAGSISATGIAGYAYTFTDFVSTVPTVYFYRLKMVDYDGRFTFSNILRINVGLASPKLAVFPNPARDVITITASGIQEAQILNSAGQVVKRLQLDNGSRTLDISAWQAGMYVIRTNTETLKFFRQ